MYIGDCSEGDVPSVTKAYWPSVLKNANLSSIYKQFINDGKIDMKWCEELLVKHGANPNWPIGVNPNEKGETPSGMTVLIRAVLDDNVEVARLLLKHGADPNQYEKPCPNKRGFENDYFYYPLASKEDHLFQQGLVPNSYPPIYTAIQCPLSIALKKENKDMISLLKLHGATADTPINKDTYYSMNPLCLVAAKKWNLMTEEMKHDKKLMLLAVKQDYCALEHASNELKNDKEIVMAAVKQYVSRTNYDPQYDDAGEVLSFASVELQNDKDFVMLLKI